VQHVSGGPEFIDWESKVNARTAPDPSYSTKLLRKILHTKEAHERYLMSRSLISELAGREKMVQQPSFGDTS
jgi:hypothetical protein